MDERANDVGAAIDVGSNSIHLLVARLRERGAGGSVVLEPLDDRSELLGLGDVADRLGHIPPDDRRTILATLGDYLGLARANGAGQITLMGTEPFRRAANAADVAAEVRAVTGLPLQILSVRLEAELTFLGVTGGRPPSEPLVVIDIGGGSTEIAVHEPGSPLRVAALPIGSARLTNAIVEHDPPTEAELERLHRSALAVKRDLPGRPGHPYQPLRAVFVGGTATNLARLGRLSRAGLAEDRLTLARLTAVQVTDHFGVRPRRAHQLAAGAAIVEVLLGHFGLDDALTSDASLRDGAIIATARFDDAWPERVAEMFGGG